jgi:hypothetical protein
VSKWSALVKVQLQRVWKKFVKYTLTLPRSFLDVSQITQDRNIFFREMTSYFTNTKHMWYWIFPSSGLLRGVRWFETDVLGLPIGSIFKIQAVHVLKTRSTGSPETSVLNHLTQRNNPEDGRIHFNRSWSPRPRVIISPLYSRLVNPSALMPKLWKIGEYNSRLFYHHICNC